MEIGPGECGFDIFLNLYGGVEENDTILVLKIVERNDYTRMYNDSMRTNVKRRLWSYCSSKLLVKNKKAPTL